MTLTEHLTSVADAIREKTGETAEIPALEFAERILAIKSGSSELVAKKTSATFPSGISSRSVSVSFSSLSSIKFAVAFGVSSFNGALVSGLYLGRSDDTITVSRNKLTLTAQPATSSEVELTVIAIGEPA